MAAYTFDQIAKHTDHRLIQAIMNIARQDSSILEVMPFSFWGQAKFETYLWENSRPTAQEYDDDDTINETTGDDDEVTMYLKRLGHQFAIENFQSGTMEGAEAKGIVKGSRALGEKLRTRFYNGVSTTVAIGTGSGTKGVDAVIPGPRMKDGVGSLKFNDTGDLLQFKAPGDTAYGTAVAVTADLNSAHDYLFSGNKSWWIRLTFDISDSAGGGNWEYTDTTDGLTFTTSKQMDGLQSLVLPTSRYYGTKSLTTPSTNGDNLTLNLMDFGFRSLKGPRNRKVALMRGNLIDYLRGLLGANARPADWQGQVLGPDTIDYRGYACLPDDFIAGAETVGSTTDCSSVIFALLDEEEGVCCRYGKSRKNAAMTKLPDDNSSTGVAPVPFYIRELPEKDDKDQTPVRMTAYMNLRQKNAQSLFELHGIKQA